MAMNPIVSVPRDYQQWSNNVIPVIDFPCKAGVYTFTATATAWGTAQLQRMVADPVLGAEYINIGAAIVANGMTEYHLAAGQYHWAIAGTTGFSGVFERTGSWAGR